MRAEAGRPGSWRCWPGGSGGRGLQLTAEGRARGTHPQSGSGDGVQTRGQPLMWKGRRAIGWGGMTGRSSF